MRPLTWALKEVDTVGPHRQSGIHAQEILKFKFAPHKQKSIISKNWQKDGGRWPIGPCA